MAAIRCSRSQEYAAVTQARQKLGSESLRSIFKQSQAQWHDQSEHPYWCGLNLCGVDGVVWRTPDTAENSQAVHFK